MSHSLHWSSKAHFYPLGNTPPVCLTQDLSPEQSADILLLGCGDPRHILFTLYADLTVPQRPHPLTFTCCDLDPAILARNVILLTLLDDGAPVDSVWDIFYHFQIGDVALSLLVRRCHKLLAISSSPQNWRESPYGSFLKFFDARTLDELRRHWSLYAEFPKLRKVTLNKFREQKDYISTSVLERREVLFVASLMASRSAGPLLPRAVGPVTEALVKYWKTGTIHQRPEDIKKARHLNPTFIYSLSGEMFNIHYGTFPQGSHFAPVLAPLAPKQPGFTRMLQFNTWVRAFQASRKSNAINIWLYAGDALAFCHALREHSRTGRASTNMPIAPWRAAQIDFNQITADHTPPSAFDIIDTSNLTDHLGLLNILVGAQPLLKIQPVSQSVLYTESLILSSKSVTDSLQSRLKTTMSTVGLLLGLIPHPYLAGFTTQSHTEELMMSPETHGNYRERIAWVHPASGDPHFRNQGQPRLTLYPKDLAVLLADMFGNMFPNKRFPLRSLFFKSSPIAMREENLLQYHHGSFAALFELLQDRMAISGQDWALTAHLLLTLAHKRRWFSKRVELQELALHLFRLAVQSSRSVNPDTEDWGILDLQAIASDQSALCVVLTIPRNNLRVLLENPRAVGSFALQCKMTSNRRLSHYTSIQTAWGRCLSSGDSSSVVIQEDPAGSSGNSGLVVTFWVAANILEHHDATVAFGIRPTPMAYAIMGPLLGPSFDFFSANVHTSRHVQILPYRPALPGEPQQTWSSIFDHSVDTPPVARGAVFHGTVTSGWTTPSQITSLAGNVDAKVPSVGSSHSRQGKNIIRVRQVAPCTMELSIRGQPHQISYPYPVHSGSCKLLLTGQQLEMSVPLAELPDYHGHILNSSPMLQGNKHTRPRNIHHINLERMPIIDLSDPQKLDWLPNHLEMQLSVREKAEIASTAGPSSAIKSWSRVKEFLGNRTPSEPNVLSPLTELKRSITKMILAYSGLSGRSKKMFWLKEASSDPYAWVLPRALRLDLTSSTVILDSAAIWFPNEMRSRMMFNPANKQKDSDVLVTTLAEALAWRRLFPAFAERCRTWAHRPDCDYVTHREASSTGSLDANPLCECGKSAEVRPPWLNAPEWKGLPHRATRVAISPLFPAPYLEKILDAKQQTSPMASPQNKDPFGLISSQKRGYHSHSRAIIDGLPAYCVLGISLKCGSIARSYPFRGFNFVDLCRFGRRI